MKTKNEVSAGGIVYKETESGVLWLITQHSYHKGWVFPKGLIGDKTSGESMETAALREVEEEGGVRARIIDPEPVEVNYSYRWKDSSHGKNDTNEYLVNKKVFYYLMEYISGDPKNHDWEMSDAKFVTEWDATELLSFTADKQAYKEIREKFKKSKPESL